MKLFFKQVLRRNQFKTTYDYGNNLAIKSFLTERIKTMNWKIKLVLFLSMIVLTVSTAACKREDEAEKPDKKVEKSLSNEVKETKEKVTTENSIIEIDEDLRSIPGGINAEGEWEAVNKKTNKTISESLNKYKEEVEAEKAEKKIEDTLKEITDNVTESKI
jgi:hypothetical protein